MDKIPTVTVEGGSMNREIIIGDVMIRETIDKVEIELPYCKQGMRIEKDRFKDLIHAFMKYIDEMQTKKIIAMFVDTILNDPMSDFDLSDVPKDLHNLFKTLHKNLEG